MVGILLPLNNLTSSYANHLKFILNVLDHKNQDKFDFGLYRVFCFENMQIDFLERKKSGCRSITLVPLYHLIWNLYTRSETIKGWPNFILTTFFIQDLPPSPPPKKISSGVLLHMQIIWNLWFHIFIKIHRTVWIWF